MNKWKETEFGKIPEEWELKSILELKSGDKNAIAMGPFGSNIKAENFVKDGVPVIRGTNFNFDKYVGGEFVFLSEEKANELKGSNCKPGDLVFTHRGTIGQVALIPEGKYNRYVISQSGMKLTIDETKINNQFLFYFFKSKGGQYQLLKNEAQVGVPSISNPLTTLKELLIPIPKLNEQIQIANILSSLDDKIDLLQRQNNTLEQLAETVFRRWFVEEADDSFETGKLDEVISVKGGTTPSTSIPEYWNGEINWTSPRDLSNHNSVYLFNTERKITEVGLAKIGSGLLPIGTVLLSSRAPIGYLAITQIPVAINQGYIAILCDKKVSNYFIYLWCKSNLELIKSSGNGSVFQEISKSTFRDLDILLPPLNKLNEFDFVIEPIFRKIKSNSIQIRYLINIRDSLLPNLMSGELLIND